MNRREFLKLFGKAAVIAAVPSVALAKNTSPFDGDVITGESGLYIDNGIGDGAYDYSTVIDCNNLSMDELYGAIVEVTGSRHDNGKYLVTKVTGSTLDIEPFKNHISVKKVNPNKNWTAFTGRKKRYGSK